MTSALSCLDTVLSIQLSISMMDLQGQCLWHQWPVIGSSLTMTEFHRALGDIPQSPMKLLVTKNLPTKDLPSFLNPVTVFCSIWLFIISRSFAETYTTW